MPPNPKSIILGAFVAVPVGIAVLTAAFGGFFPRIQPSEDGLDQERADELGGKGINVLLIAAAIFGVAAIWHVASGGLG